MDGIIVIIVIVMILLDDLVQQPFGFLFESPNIRSYVPICLQWLGRIDGRLTRRVICIGKLSSGRIKVVNRGGLGVEISSSASSLPEPQTNFMDDHLCFLDQFVRDLRDTVLHPVADLLG